MSLKRAFSEIITHLEKLRDSSDEKIVGKIMSLVSSSKRVFSRGAGRKDLVAINCTGLSAREFLSEEDMLVVKKMES